MAKEETPELEAPQNIALKVIVSKEQLGAARTSWQAASDSLHVEERALDAINEGHDALVNLLQENGITRDQAEVNFKHLVGAQRELLAAQYAAANKLSLHFLNLLHAYEHPP
nr:hypothetical protein [uncultured Albidiferax sp.]